MAKAAAGDCQRLVVRDGLQLHGGIGFTWEHDLHLLLKRATTGELLFGTAAFHRARVAELLGLEAGRMKLRFDDSVEAFRAELLELARRATAPTPRRWRPTRRSPPAMRRRGPAAGPARMFDAGWLVPGWPPELRWARRGPDRDARLPRGARQGPACPRTTNVAGARASSCRRSSTTARDEQIRDYAMPILRGEATACLGMSEPGAGSDLAALSTRAVLDGDEWVIDGQKVWTSGANYADFCFLFCRTDPDAPKHKGISIVLVPDGHARASPCGRCPRSSGPSTRT